MSVDEKVNYLLRAATRAEGRGDQRIARIFRRVAEESRPMDARAVVAGSRLGTIWCTE